eukprot:scaffold1690_cov182-Amphora_coffeaeformis.AAC.28
MAWAPAAQAVEGAKLGPHNPPCSMEIRPAAELGKTLGTKCGERRRYGRRDDDDGVVVSAFTNWKA